MSGDPVEATFMLDSGLTTNLVTPELFAQLDLPESKLEVRGNALGGATKGLKNTFLPALELLGGSSDQRAYAGVWKGDGWRAWCSLDWDDWVARSEGTAGRIAAGTVSYTVLPSPSMTEAQVENLVGRGGTETVEGEMFDGATRFDGRGVEVVPSGFLSITESYQFEHFGEELVEKQSGMRLRRRVVRPSMVVQGPLHAICTRFAQSQLAEAQGARLDGMLGQLPLHQDFAVEVDPSARRLSLHAPDSAAAVAAATGLVRVLGTELGSRLMAVQMSFAPLLQPSQPAGDAPAASARPRVPAIIDTGSANTILNWPAAELLLGIRKEYGLLREARMMRAVGVGGAQVDMPLLTLSLALDAEDGSSEQPQPVQVSIGDASIFEELVGFEESGSWPFGLGPKRLRPAALIGQDILSQRRYMLAASEPALYLAPTVPSAPGAGRLQFEGFGDCVDAGGRRLRGLQKLGCTPDDAVSACFALPADTCQGVAVTPLTEKSYSGLCYVFVADDGASKLLEPRGFRRYEAPPGRELAPHGALVAATTGDKGAECYSWNADV